MRDLFIDIQDGKILMALLEVLSGQKLVCIQEGKTSIDMELCMLRATMYGHPRNKGEFGPVSWV